jgi:hypothetical protein
MPALDAQDIPTAPRFDHDGEIRYLGHVYDKGRRTTWVVIRRKGASRAFAIALDAWLSLAKTPEAARQPISLRLGPFGEVR